MFNNIKEERWKIYRARVEFLELELLRFSDPRKGFEGLNVVSLIHPWKGESRKYAYILEEVIRDLKVFDHDLEKMSKENNTVPRAIAREVIKMSG